jgi:hypothetical protein
MEDKEGKVIVLDGKEITQEELDEVQKKSNIRLFEEGENKFRTLTRMTE